ncbi:MraY family glycosyltransferase [Nocardioides flavescens]|uniref:Undecaprenyl/decaprenyl-phosphate alpha-N-acetylglucosaminyl 1-phosphate transferase n=1 Tax=Nocardioides flavescens TaxID=2691959 RepID=A0A6L7F3Q3_9ACTN|nr:undecaprenyl/decaprenyl-phosphate alpha-N-acetylglucosaminyl 1-phosphate transferase [Nocardioides flavescens]
MREYLLVFLVAASSTYLLTVVAREIALRSGAVARVRDRDVHDEPIPYLGGLAMLGGLVAAYLVARELPFLSSTSPVVFRDAGIVLIAGALICAVGVLDDLFELDALTKLGGQVLASGFLVAFGIQFFFFTDARGNVFALDGSQGALLTGFLVVATINAVNFVDGLDGLAAGVVGVGSLAFFTFCYALTRLNGAERATTSAFLSIALAGVCIGFLVHNFHPARLFMGDSGSMLLGLVLSASAVTLSGQFSPEQLAAGAGGARASLLPTLLPVLLPISLLLVPIADLVLAVVRRTRAGRSPFAPDKQHLHHRLLEIGHSQRRAVLIMWLWAALVAFGTVLASLYSGTWVLLAVGGMTAVTIAATFVLPVLTKPRLPGTEDA